MSESRLPAIITSLYSLVDELEKLFPERRFTLDGHLVGSIGEVAAKYFYNLRLLPPSSPCFDALAQDGSNRSVQIKLTGGNVVSIAVNENVPDLLIVLRIDRRSGFHEVYNGLYPVSFLAGKSISKRQVKTVSLRQLENEQSHIQRCLDDEGRIKELNSHFIKGDS
jgi:hypothetical protein